MPNKQLLELTPNLWASGLCVAATGHWQKIVEDSKLRHLIADDETSKGLWRELLYAYFSLVSLWFRSFLRDVESLNLYGSLVLTCLDRHIRESPNLKQFTPSGPFLKPEDLAYYLMFYVQDNLAPYERSELQDLLQLIQIKKEDNFAYLMAKVHFRVCKVTNIAQDSLEHLDLWLLNAGILLSFADFLKESRPIFQETKT